jgi:5-methyltetrahydropteroyltriglutamate--homocysteine methyltransferase
MHLRALGTQLVGSYAKPAWLIDRDRILEIDGSAWKVAPDRLPEAQRDAARLAIHDQESVGLDIVTDGEMRRSAFDRYFYCRLGGIDALNLADRTPPAREISTVAYDQAHEQRRRKAFAAAPRIVGPIEWIEPLAIEEVRLAKSLTRRPVKVAVVGPVTTMDRLANEYYPDDRSAAMAVARAFNSELLALQSAGADVIQVDEPAFHYSLSRFKQYGLDALDVMIAGVSVPIVLHVCYGYAHFVKDKSASPIYAEVLSLASRCQGIDYISIEYEQPQHTPEILTHVGDKGVVLGLLNLGTTEVESTEHIAGRIREARSVVPAERLNLAPDCGMWHLPRDIAYRKIRSLALAAQIVRHELGL